MQLLLLTKYYIFAVIFSKTETNSSDDSCFEVERPSDNRVCQSSDSLSENEENVTIDLNGQSTTQDSVSALSDLF